MAEFADEQVEVAVVVEIAPGRADGVAVVTLFLVTGGAVLLGDVGELALAVVVPEQAGALSALGMLLADATRDYSSGVLGRADVAAAFASLERRARREFPGAEIERSVPDARRAPGRVVARRLCEPDRLPGIVTNRAEWAQSNRC